METAGRTKILVVDDEQTIANTLSWVLDREGYETRAAFNGEEAIEVAQTFAPDVLICDVFMEGISGLDAAIEITESYPACKVLLVSGHVSISDLSQQAAEKGHKFHYLAKPVHPRTLLEFLRTLLQRP
jgi:two-component system, OmpR family, alkaline phosphatase synthesis response regulator PhoP